MSRSGELLFSFMYTAEISRSLTLCNRIQIFILCLQISPHVRNGQLGASGKSLAFSTPLLHGEETVTGS